MVAKKTLIYLTLPLISLTKTVLSGPVTLVPALIINDNDNDDNSITNSLTEEAIETHISPAEEELSVDYEQQLVCNSQTCYPLIFEPLAEWQEIKPQQQLPKGLNIRINMETGKKEAKLSSAAVQENSLKEQEEVHEFVKHFDNLRDGMEKNDLDKIIANLDELMEFSHDYKHGYKLIRYEQHILMDLIFNDNSNLKIIEMASRLIAACLRNNPPAIEIFYPKHVDQIVNGLLLFKNDIIIKRFINILQTVASKANHVDQLYSNLQQVYFSCEDQDIKIKILDILSTLELISSTQFNNGIVKRSSDLEDARVWFDEFCQQIQNQDLDEYHIRKFYNTLIQLKEQTGFKIENKAFMKWISDQAVARRENLKSGASLDERDLEEDEFNKIFLDSRHAVFGNRMANRMKNYQDEL